MEQGGSANETANETATTPVVRSPRFAIGVALYVITVVVIALTVFDGGDDPRPSPHDRRAVATATTTTTTPLRTPTTGDPLRILVAGDSLVGWIAPALEGELTGKPVEIVDDWKGSSGLVRPDYFDWPARLATDMAEHDPEVVIVGFGGNDAQNLTTDDGILLVGTPEWQDEYQRRVEQVLDVIEHDGRTLYWIGMPLTQAGAIEAIRPAITDAVHAAVDGRPWVRWVDTMDALAPDGGYHVFLPGPDGTEVRVRADDGVHPSPEGGRFIVRTFLAELREERHLP